MQGREKKGGSKAPGCRLQELAEWGMKVLNIGINQFQRLNANIKNPDCISTCLPLLDIKTLPETHPKNM